MKIALGMGIKINNCYYLETFKKILPTPNFWMVVYFQILISMQCGISNLFTLYISFSKQNSSACERRTIEQPVEGEKSKVRSEDHLIFT